MTQYANYIITAIGLFGFFLAGKKVWWCWYVNIFNQALWFVYGIATEQWGFVLGTFFYTFVFCRNAVVWTREHRRKQDLLHKPIGEIKWLSKDEHGIKVGGVLTEEAAQLLKEKFARERSEEWSMHNVVFVNRVTMEGPRFMTPNSEGGPVSITGEVSLHNEVDRELLNASLWHISKPNPEWLEEFNKRTSRDRWVR